MQNFILKQAVKEASKLATLSKDPSSKVGAVLITKESYGELEIVGRGFNRFPTDVIETSARLNDRPNKYMFMLHAELDCIMEWVSRMDTLSSSQRKSRNAAMVVYGFNPCTDCLKQLLGFGLRDFYYYIPESYQERLRANWELSQTSSEMLRETGSKWIDLRDLGITAPDINAPS